ncbi:MAG: restriction endonuclease [Vicinamibacterales bacterium]|nr:restriction endonuclease [Vicinamibacterales bacterium]
MADDNLIHVGQATRVFAVSGRVLGVQVELSHRGLNKHRVIKANDAAVLQRKAEVQILEWQQQWAAKSAILARDRDRNARQQDKAAGIELADKATAEAKAVQEELTRILVATLSKNDVVDWDGLKDKRAFPKPKPAPARQPPVPKPKLPPAEPNRASFAPAFGLLDKLLSSRRVAKEEDAEAKYDDALRHWQQQCEGVQAANTEAADRHREQLARLEDDDRKACLAWEAERETFAAAQREANASIDAQRAEYEKSVPGAIEGYCDMVLTRSNYPDCFPKEWDVAYLPETRIAVVNYFLPSPDEIPTVVEVRYVASKNEFTEKRLSPGQLGKLYDEILYQVTLRTLHELFEADVVGAFDTVAFNGYVKSIDKATGKEVTACVLSVTARRQEFLAINLASVDPRACFKSLKGVGSSKLHSITPVAPVIALDREDPRFVQSYEVAKTLDEGYNLAAMDWEDFEHLIREVFEREFAAVGGEVKVTQASRDGGVDAVVFDPDPIRGGKIVIQAKRYTGTVGVSAVRDLYGTLMNEGATKGILVTTSDYGPDAYEFAKGKPLTLLNGGNLLHLLEKHGHKAKIDLKEARALSLEKAGS